MVVVLNGCSVHLTFIWEVSFVPWEAAVLGKVMVSEVIPGFLLGAPVNLLAACYAFQNKWFGVCAMLTHEDSS